ncbi:MAG: hypothetical protein J5J06_09360 [Phycisphaerae bacterium]|nr:hypothetical protein [Phycisphaerae bacterium]
MYGLLVIGACTFLGCHDPTPPPAVGRGMGTSDVWGLRPGDLESCAQRMARDLITDPLLRRPDPPVRIGIVSIENHTNEPFVGGSADMVLDRVQTIIFRSLRANAQESGSTAKFVTMREGVRRAIDEQRAGKRSGELSSRGLNDLHGVDYFLSGVYHANDKAAAGKRMIEMLMTFDLTDAESGESYWRNDYLVKTVTPQ